MNRDEFKLKLAAKLHVLSDDERAEIFSFFDECLDEALDNSETEAQAIERLGSLDEIAVQLLTDRETKAAGQREKAASINTFDTAGLTGIRVEARDAGVSVKSSDAETISVKYDVHQDEEFSAYVEDGVLVVKERLPRKWMHWLKGIFGWESVRWLITIEMPKRFDGFIDIISSNHALSAEGVHLGSLSARTSNSKVTVDGITSSGQLKIISSNCVTKLHSSTIIGDVHVETSNSLAEVRSVHCQGEMSVQTGNSRLLIEDCSAAAISARTSNGKASLYRVAAENELTVKTSNGPIEVGAISASKLIKLASSNARITGMVSGSATQYTVVTRTSNGKALPPSGGSGAVRLEAVTSNAKINLEFEKPYKLVFSDSE